MFKFLILFHTINFFFLLHIILGYNIYEFWVLGYIFFFFLSITISFFSYLAYNAQKSEFLDEECLKLRQYKSNVTRIRNQQYINRIRSYMDPDRYDE